jgi:quinoprotein glucose dehydrogenase
VGYDRDVYRKPCRVTVTNPSSQTFKTFEPAEKRRGLGFLLSVCLALALIVLGLVIGAGGGWLILLGGSWYYLFAAAGLVVSGFLLLNQRPAAVWIYLAVWLGTLIWACWEVGFNGWALVPRVVGPTLILPFLLLAGIRLRKESSDSLTRIYAPTTVAALTLVALLGGGLLAHRFLSEDSEVGEAAPQVTLTEPTPAESRVDGNGETSNGISTTPGKNLHAGVDWPAYGGSSLGMRYSPLTEITPENVSKLEKVWTFRTGDMPSERSEGRYSPENTPLKVGDRLFVCSAKNILISINAVSGKEEWRFDPKVADDAIPFGATCRGASYYETSDPAKAGQVCASRIIEGTLDARLIAVDAKTGKPCSDFGQNGSVDLKDGLGETFTGFYAVTSPPAIVRGVAVVGAQVSDNQARNSPSGVVRGFDVITGKLAWAWDMGHPDRSGAPPPGDTYTRGTPNMWAAAAGDEELGYVYAPLGSPANDYYGAGRTAFENEYSTSIVAIDVTTGKEVWHFQTVHHDLWDYDLASQPSLVDLQTEDGRVPALILPSKQGQIYALNRKTGKPIFPVEERGVPTGGVEPQALAKTQPYSGYVHVDQPKLTEKDMWGMSPIDQLWCRIQFKRASYDGEYTPPKLDRAYIEYPGFNGGSEWGGVAVDTERGILVTNYNDMPNLNWLVPRAKINRMGIRAFEPRVASASQEGSDSLSLLGFWRKLTQLRSWRTFYYAEPQEGAPYGVHILTGWQLPTGLPCKQPPYGHLRAVDLKTGKTLWDNPIGTARNNGPFGIPSMLPITIGTPVLGGPLITAGGLIFIGGTTDDTFRAVDIKTGKVAWEDQLPAGGQATPMTYEADGRQFVVIAPGGHHFMQTKLGDYVVAYALPKAH